MSLKKGKKKTKSPGVNREARNMLMLSGNPIWRAFAKEPISQKTQTSIGLAGRKSLYALSNGAGEFEHCKELMVTAYAGIFLAEQGYGEDLLDDFYGALAAVHECRNRARSGGAFSLDESDARKVDVLLDLHEQQLGLAEKADLAAAIVESYRRVGDSFP
jgi:hypothetical protein